MLPHGVYLIAAIVFSRARFPLVYDWKHQRNWQLASCNMDPTNEAVRAQKRACVYTQSHNQFQVANLARRVFGLATMHQLLSCLRLDQPTKHTALHRKPLAERTCRYQPRSALPPPLGRHPSTWSDRQRPQGLHPQVCWRTAGRSGSSCAPP